MGVREAEEFLFVDDEMVEDREVEEGELLRRDDCEP
jgi:hypothetical protein